MVGTVGATGVVGTEDASVKGAGIEAVSSVGWGGVIDGISGVAGVPEAAGNG